MYVVHKHMSTVFHKYVSTLTCSCICVYWCPSYNLSVCIHVDTPSLYTCCLQVSTIKYKPVYICRIRNYVSMIVSSNMSLSDMSISICLHVTTSTCPQLSVYKYFSICIQKYGTLSMDVSKGVYKYLAINVHKYTCLCLSVGPIQRFTQVHV